MLVTEEDAVMKKWCAMTLRERDPPAPDSALTLAKKAPRITPKSPVLSTPQELVELSCVAMPLS